MTNLLPPEKTFYQSFLPYFVPYALYVAIGAIPNAYLTPENKQLVKFIAVSASMIGFFKWYRFGKWDPKLIGISIVAAPVALLLWIVSLYFIDGRGGAEDNISTMYFTLRMLNSTLLVAMFEELFIRVYVMQWLYQAGQQRKAKGLFASVLDTLHQKPLPLSVLPLSLFSVTLVTLIFALGHTQKEWISAILYLSFTNVIYQKTGSLWVCILIHAISNLVIAVLAMFGGMAFLWQ